MNNLQREKLLEFISTFYGYGDLKSNIWFIGMEEGGGNTLEEVNARIQAWVTDGKNITADIFSIHQAISQTEYFNFPKPKLQRTWAKLIRMQLALEAQTVTSELVAEFQAKRLGRLSKNTCLLELLPLPAPNLNSWCYSELTQIAFLESRSAYKKEMLPKRISGLRQLIRKHKPEYVIFYGKLYQPYWRQIAGCTLKPIEGGKLFFGHDTDTCFVMAPHPVARGVKNSDFELHENLFFNFRHK